MDRRNPPQHLPSQPAPASRRPALLRLGGLLLGLGLLVAWRGAAAESQPPAHRHHSAVARVGQPLHLLRLGSGPPVAFLHGLGGDSSVWIDELLRLQATHTVLLIDLPGHGQSPPAPPHIELSVVARQVAAVIAAQHLGPVVLVGHSLGGTLAGYVALAEPQLIRGLVVVDSMFIPYGIAEVERTKLRFQLSRDPALALHDFFQPLAHDPRQLDKIVAGARQVSGQTLSAYLDFVSERDDLLLHAAELRQPVHVMASPLLTSGHSDPVEVRQALGRVGFGSIGALSFDYFANANHYLFWDEPAAFHKSLTQFLNRVEAQPPLAPLPPPLKLRKRSNLARASRRL